MPELPEVEVVRRGLERHVLQKPINRVEVLHPRPVRRHLAGPDDFADALTGRRFVAARRRGKYLWLALDDPEIGDAMLVHLGMSGQMLVQPVDAAIERHLRVRFDLGDGAELRFVDQRMFGGLALSTGGARVPTEIAHIALDPLDPAFDDEAFVARARRSSSGIKRILLNQTMVSGVGNIYADEGLWRARINGERPGATLTRPRVRELLEHVRAVMTSALAQGGTSFDALYVNVKTVNQRLQNEPQGAIPVSDSFKAINGQSGYFARSLSVYGRQGQPCERCGAPVRRIAFMNRSSFFCPRCQRPPRGS